MKPSGVFVDTLGINWVYFKNPVLRGKTPHAGLTGHHVNFIAY